MDRTLPSVIPAFERQYRNDHNREHALLIDSEGHVVRQSAGDYDSVHFENADLDKARGGAVTHTHPRALPPSKEDLLLAARYDLLLRAVGTAPDTGQRYDYTVRIPSTLAHRIDQRFDDEVDRAEKQLASLPYGDLQWQRESRHLAIRRLSHDLNFVYQRVEKRSPLSEATKHERARLDAFATLENTMRDDVFVPLYADVMRVLRRTALRDRLALSQIDTIRTALQAVVQRLILGTALHGEGLHPYIARRGEIVPRSAYFKVLWEAMRGSGQLAADRHAEMMRKYLPPDLVKALEYATVDPFATDLSEMDEGPDLSGHDPLHLWTGPDGRRLLERLWNVAGDLYRRLDKFVSAAISGGQGVNDMDKALWNYLVESKGNYEAMRLARTEVAATYSRVDSAAAALNPLVEQYQPFVSPSHKHIDACDDMVGGGPYQKKDTEHLPPYHPFCLCGVMWIMVQDVEGAIERLRAQIAAALAAGKKSLVDLIGPLSRWFVNAIFGARS